MKKQIIFRFAVFALLFVAISVVFTFGARAQQSENGQLSDDQLRQVQQDCSITKETLSRLYSSDGLSRVNGGQVYESLSTRLMTRLNSRVALSRLDGSELIAKAAEHESNLREYRDAYVEYEQLMFGVLAANCSDDPRAFNDSLIRAQELRSDVRESVVALDDSIKDYRSAVEQFGQSIDQDEEE